MDRVGELKTGFVGSGFAADFHVASMRACARYGVTPAAVFSPTRAKRDAFAERHGLHSVAELHSLVEQVDVVHVCAPAATHEEVTLAALRAGVHVLVEKPVTGSFGPATPPSEQMLVAATASAQRIALPPRNQRQCYAESFV